MNTTALAPSQTRSGLDRLYTALGTANTTLKALKETPELDLTPDQVRTSLNCALAGKAVNEVSGKWVRNVSSRTEFRDVSILGALITLKATKEEPASFKQILELLPVSTPQLYTSLARLRIGNYVMSVRDGSRTPNYYPI
ncbi:hypothetical protein UFOVP1519_32 [uncultured Caudovirales phage]|uniref:Uncharacterized protein n=1 Tax=uncultured Caudovirales phage TaxID=2100421 RepID=A0A6J7X954_9CAUD|nr:hypothetical protein UFOVP1306_32 [uncultured Caudovirales phage]CAB4210270.1 hypothetical protein UFOVP1422_34 [uncultured Caudovirales phage]CAB5227333.1 hypothetical protein UFOVP1519_32 [uncultured Caudovirales phage]